MTPKTLLGISLAAVFAIGMIASPIGADAMGSFLDVKNAKVKTDSSEVEKAIFSTKGAIPTDGSGNAFGYGYITDAGLEAIAVTTTHGGIKDSVAQSDANDARFHNHYVSLTDTNGLCGELAVVNISFEEPGDVDIDNKKAIMEDVPYDFIGTHSLTGDYIHFDSDPNVGNAVHFTIGPVDKLGNPTLDPTEIIDGGAVCINDVTFVEKLTVKDVSDRR